MSIGNLDQDVLVKHLHKVKKRPRSTSQGHRQWCELKGRAWLVKFACRSLYVILFKSYIAKVKVDNRQTGQISAKKRLYRGFCHRTGSDLLLFLFLLHTGIFKGCGYSSMLWLQFLKDVATGNKSPKGHWSLTWVQWALLLKVRFLSTSESMTAIFVKSVRTATIAIYQFRIRGCIRFVAVTFWSEVSEEEILWRRNPSLTYFWQIAPPPWICPWVEFAEKPINRCVIIGTSSLSSFVNMHQVVL